VRDLFSIITTAQHHGALLFHRLLHFGQHRIAQWRRARTSDLIVGCLDGGQVFDPRFLYIAALGGFHLFQRDLRSFIQAGVFDGVGYLAGHGLQDGNVLLGEGGCL